MKRTSNSNNTLLLERKEKKIMPIYKYRHEDEPVDLVLITVFRDAAWVLCLRTLLLLLGFRPITLWL